MAENLSPEEAVSRLEAFWDLPDGVLYRLRQGEYDAERIRAVETLLRQVQIGSSDQLPRRFVALVWMLPTFLEWQVERVGDRGGDVAALQRDANRIRSALEELLGVA